MGLIDPERKREHRARRVIPRREDGTADYEPPAGRADRWNAYFVIPDSFWTDEIFAKLTLSGLAMLLVLAKETNLKKETWPTYAKGPAWYGISAKSVQNGVANLVKHNLIAVRTELVKAPLSKSGSTTRSWYTLTGDFGHQARADVRKRTRNERAARLKRDTVLVPWDDHWRRRIQANRVWATENGGGYGSHRHIRQRST
jgi:hypothetical protein